MPRRARVAAVGVLPCATNAGGRALRALCYKSGMRRGLRSFIVVLALVLATTGAVLASRMEEPRSMWTDARDALSWENPLCTPMAAFRGLTKARAVTQHTDEIQRASKLVGEDQEGLFLYQTPFGDFWMPQRNDLHSLAVVLAEQGQEMYGSAAGLGVHAGDVVIDAGAHVGLFARTALEAGASKVATFEVTPASNRALRRNLAGPIAEGRVVVVEKGVWFEDGTLPLVIADGCSICNSVSHPWLKATMEVPLTTIDHAVEDLGLNRVDFIKLDVENAEANALRGATATLARFHPRVAVALENAKSRIAYGHEVIGIMQETFAGYHYTCGAITNADTGERVLPEVLHFYAD